MDVEVLILGIKNQPFQKKIIHITQDFVIIKDLLQNLDKQFNVNIENEIIDKGALKRGYVILINGRSISSLNNLETQIRDGDKIFITVFIAGG